MRHPTKSKIDEKESCQIAWIALNAVKNLNVGSYKLAEFLKGSKSKKIGYLKNEQIYGGLFWHDIGNISYNEIRCVLADKNLEAKNAE